MHGGSSVYSDHLDHVHKYIKNKCLNKTHVEREKNVQKIHTYGTTQIILFDGNMDQGPMAPLLSCMFKLSAKILNTTIVSHFFYFY